MIASTIEESYELSPMQQGMLVDSLTGREPGVDIVQIVCHLDEEMEIAPLARAWSRVVRRHPILRTAFRVRASGEPLQDVYAEVALPFERLDWRGVPEREVAERWRSFVEADRLRGFDLFRPPLLRLVSVTLGDREHRLLWELPPRRVGRPGVSRCSTRGLRLLRCRP